MRPRPPRIACLAWGSLHRKPGALPLAALSRRRGPRPGADEGVACLDRPQGAVRRYAEDYVQQVPPDIRTLYRNVIEVCLGWSPRAGGGAKGGTMSVIPLQGDTAP